MKKSISYLPLVLLYVCFCIEQCQADWNNSPQGIGQGIMLPLPTISISDGNGGEIICSKDNRLNGVGALYIQHLDANGLALWGDYSLYGGTGKLITKLESLAFGSNFSMVTDNANGALVVWIQNEHEIRAQRISSSGAFLWAAGGVLVGQCSGSDEFRSLKSVANISGGFYISWQLEANPSVPLPRLQLVNASGVPQFSLSGIQIDGDDRMISDNAGGVFLAWRPYASLGTPKKIIAQRINSSGTELWGSNGKELNQFNELIGSTGFDIMQLSGGLMLTYSDSTNVWQDVFVKRLDANGNFIFGAVNGVNITNDPDYITSIYITSDNSSGALIYWVANGNLKMKRITANANPIWVGVPISVFSGLSVNSAISVAVNSSNFFVKASYSWANNSGTNVQKISALNGAKLWGADGLTLVDNMGDASGSDIICDNASNIIVNATSIYFPTLNEKTKGAKLRAYKMNTSGVHLWGSTGVPMYTERDISSNPPAICHSLSGYHTAWEDIRHPDTARIYHRFVHLNGDKNIDSTSVDYFGKRVSLRNSDQTTPVCISDNAGGAIIVWADKTSGDKNIYAQRMDSSGARLWGNNGVAICTATAWQVEPQIIEDAVGGYIIMWEDARIIATLSVYAQKINENGVIQWATNGIAVSPAQGVHPNPQIVPATAGGALIAWEDNRNGNYDIYAQRINSNGTFNWSVNGIEVCTQTSTQENVSISPYGTNGSIISWSDYRNGNYDIYAQRVNGVGNTQWTNNGIPICNVAATQRHVISIPDSTDKCIIAWLDYRNGESNVYAQKVDGNGLSLWTSNGINTQPNAAGNNFNPKLISDGKHGAIIVVADDRYSGTEHHIYAHRIDQDGNRVTNSLWNNGSISSATLNTYHQAYTNICSDGKNGLVAFWNDQYQNQINNVSIQRVNHEGFVGAIPDISLSGNNISIEDNDTLPSLNDRTDFGLRIVGSSITNTFIVQNLEYGTLNVYNYSISGADASSFSILGFDGGSLNYNQSFSFNIIFNPWASGLKTATITITSNDPNEATYTFKVQGRGYTPSVINTYAGNGNAGNTGNGGAAIKSQLHTPTVLTSDSIGNIYFADSAYHVIRKVDTNGIITLFAGTGVSGYNGENITRLSAQIKSPTGMAYRKQNGGELFFAEAENNRVRKIQMSTGLITTLVGTGVSGYNGTGLAGTATQLANPLGICTDGTNLFIADNGNNRIRKVSLSGTNTVSNFAGNGNIGYSGDGNIPTSATLNNPVDVCLSNNSTIVYIADKGNHVIRKVYPFVFVDFITTYVGTGVPGYSGNNAPLSTAKLNGPNDVEVDSDDVLYISDGNNHRVCKVGNIFILGDVLINEAGTSVAGYSGDGGPGENAKLNAPKGLCIDTKNRIFIADKANHRIRILGDVTQPALITRTPIEGFYASGGNMDKVLYNQGVTTETIFSDSILVELHDTAAPYPLVASEKVVMDKAGYAYSNFAYYYGTFYLAFKHRNGIQTWAANTITLNGSTVNYYLNSASSAFGNNIKNLSNNPTTFGIYSGDLNQDDNIDLTDALLLETDINQFVFGYYASDLNGDGNTDLFDFSIMENNVNNFIYSIYPN